MKQNSFLEALAGAVARWEPYFCSLLPPSLHREANRQLRLASLGLSYAELHSVEPPSAIRAVVHDRVQGYASAYGDAVERSPVLERLAHEPRAVVRKDGSLDVGGASYRTEIRDVDPGLGEFVENRLHYLRSFRRDAHTRVGLFVEGAAFPITYVSFTACDRPHYSATLGRFLGHGVDVTNVVHLARAYSIDIPHANSFSYIAARLCHTRFHGLYDWITTAVNSFLGFDSASLRAAGFHPFASCPVDLRFDGAQAVPRRARLGETRPFLGVRNTLLVKGVPHRANRALERCDPKEVDEIDFALYALSELNAPENVLSTDGANALRAVRRQLEPAWDEDTRYEKYGYSAGDRPSRGQCGVTSAYLLRALVDLGWDAVMARGELQFSDEAPPIPNHCWIEVATESGRPLLIDLTADQTGYQEEIVIGHRDDLNERGLIYTTRRVKPPHELESGAMARRADVLQERMAVDGG